jgi:hypothetical protein
MSQSCLLVCWWCQCLTQSFIISPCLLAAVMPQTFCPSVCLPICFVCQCLSPSHLLVLCHRHSVDPRLGVTGLSVRLSIGLYWCSCVCCGVYVLSPPHCLRPPVCVCGVCMCFHRHIVCVLLCVYVFVCVYVCVCLILLTAESRFQDVTSHVNLKSKVSVV